MQDWFDVQPEIIRDHQAPMCRLVGLILVAVMLLAPPVSGDETDQFLLPPRESFGDVGTYISAVHFCALERAVDDLNGRIAAAARLEYAPERARRLAELHEPGTVADAARAQFGPGFLEMRTVEDALRRGQLSRVYPPGTILAYRSSFWVYAATHLPLDPRKLILLFQSSTVRVYDSFWGTDKFGHFHDLGHIYFKDYLTARAAGETEEEAMETIVWRFSRGWLSEAAVIGSMATGVQSNADLAANYVGMKFYRNLTEPEMLRGELTPPLLVRRGNYWRLNRHVRPESDFFAVFTGNHFNEALNPNVYEWGMRRPILNQLARNTGAILAFYADADGRIRTREEFVAIADQLSTYYGEDYGHSGVIDGFIGVAEGCFDWPEEP